MKEEKLMLPVSFINWFKVRRLNQQFGCLKDQSPFYGMCMNFNTIQKEEKEREKKERKKEFTWMGVSPNQGAS